MRTFLIAFVAAAIACTQPTPLPPLLDGFDGSIPPSGGGGGGGGGDAATGDAGSSAIIAAASSPKGIFLTNGLVYYTNYASGNGDGSVAVVATNGGAVTSLASAQNGPWAITVAGSAVYFTLAPGAGGGGMSEVATAGGTVTPIEQSVTGALGITADGANVYWTNDEGGGGGALVEFVPLTGGSNKQLLELGGDLSPTGLALSAGELFIPTSGSQASVLRGAATGTGNLAPLDTQAPATFADIAISPTNVYAIIDDSAPNGAIVSFPFGGGAQATVVTGLNHPGRLALDGTNLYFTDPLGGNVWVLDLTSTNAPVLFTSGLDTPLPIAVADAIYIGAADSIVRIAKL